MLHCVWDLFLLLLHKIYIYLYKICIGTIKFLSKKKKQKINFNFVPGKLQENVPTRRIIIQYLKLETVKTKYIYKEYSTYTFLKDITF